MNQILSCDCLPEWASCSSLPLSGLRAVLRKKNLPEAKAEAIYIAFIDQACSAKMTAVWPHSLLRVCF